MTYDVTTETVTAPSGMPVFEAIPVTDESCPCFVLLHERYGLVEHTMDFASDVAALGIVVLAPHLYWRYEDQEGLRDGTAGTRISDREALEMLDEVLGCAKDLSIANPSRLGMLGACATGRYPVVWGANRHLDVAVVLHGLYANREWTLNPELHDEDMRDLVLRLDAAFLGQFGELDNLISVPDVRFIRNQFEEANRSYQISLYRGAPHGWMNSTMPGRYRQRVARESFAELARFLEDHLRREAPRRRQIEWLFNAQFDADYDFSKNVRLE